MFQSWPPARASQMRLAPDLPIVARAPRTRRAHLMSTGQSETGQESDATVELEQNRSSWRWSRTADTQRMLLDAAREVFIEHGYAKASVAEVVERANSSVGSLYHHFGDKTGLYMALWDQWMSSQEERAAEAVAVARRAGESDSMTLFAAGARGYLEGAWETRSIGRLFYDRDGPSGFDAMRRQRRYRWLKQNTLLLHSPDQPAGRLTVAILTTIIGEAGQEIMGSADLGEAEQLTDAAVSIITHLVKAEVVSEVLGKS